MTARPSIRELLRPRRLVWDHGVYANGERYWTALGHDGTHWEINTRDGLRFRITVAQWDRADWSTRTLWGAKRLAARIDARPPVTPGELVYESGHPFVPGDAVTVLATVSEAWDRCPACGSRAAPQLVKPVRYSFDWWEDPQPYWRCTACGRSRADVPDVS